MVLDVGQLTTNARRTPRDRRRRYLRLKLGFEVAQVDGRSVKCGAECSVSSQPAGCFRVSAASSNKCKGSETWKVPSTRQD
jgi:hypothetical protein